MNTYHRPAFKYEFPDEVYAEFEKEVEAFIEENMDKLKQMKGKFVGIAPQGFINDTQLNFVNEFKNTLIKEKYSQYKV